MEWGTEAPRRQTLYSCRAGGSMRMDVRAMACAGIEARGA
eukprot:CAMPEP_0119424490 /NCGR_PEP_ID=MMETSP1335-20130426/32688_1 /TAXON_ID=259385 /ORGANISM="Chrysoculter rhomboideus, Strain RCC1486" /LENGTH=39 /DNA_ID= /DNA_START= /DNA_END= /DNA_ORIENTATION=